MMAEIEESLHLFRAIRERLMAVAGFRIPVAMTDMRLQIDHRRFHMSADKIFIIFVRIELREELRIPIFYVHIDKIAAVTCAEPVWICHISG